MGNLSEHISQEEQEALQRLAAEQQQAQTKRNLKDRTKALRALVVQQVKRGLRIDDAKVRFRLADADEVLMRGLVHFCGERTEWLPEYEEVAEWLTDNDGKGLMCIGDCGRGKTLITQKILPMMFQHYIRLLDGSRPAIVCYTAIDLLTRFDEISQYKTVCIDDVGTEPDQKKYGVTHNYFSELVDLCERRDKLLICSTNLGQEELIARYGLRTFDRLTALTRRVFFEGDSMRNNQ